jgi:hypothetical protein
MAIQCGAPHQRADHQHLRNGSVARIDQYRVSVLDVAFDNASIVVLSLIICSAPTQVFPLDETGIQRSVAITAGATSAGVFYTPNGTMVTKAHRILGYLEYASGLATAPMRRRRPRFSCSAPVSRSRVPSGRHLREQ